MRLSNKIKLLLEKFNKININKYIFSNIDEFMILHKNININTNNLKNVKIVHNVLIFTLKKLKKMV